MFSSRQERPRRFWAWANRLPDDRARSSPAYTRSRMLKTDGSGQPVVQVHAGGGRRLDLSQLGAVVRLMTPACPVAGALHRTKAH